MQTVNFKTCSFCDYLRNMGYDLECELTKDKKEPNDTCTKWQCGGSR